ncbi:hypothetical protein [Mycolicibacterium gadium]|jgi:hypothetical protein|uniref:DUF320 domain-containing protein n=1 Tax=Mycolicibacterium gadium TaxID=1794 RepID=A0A7I7WL33_MYCGU|nr:hypothetical protein [Mycolicibacterium gadium]MDG5481554.1 hypothetical protein [Mycolicibacterium gadium]BBZ18359.1 hypothetical protein MGAD_26940 [Mycolicibacterium gadium]
MHNIMKRASAGAVLGGSLLFTAGLGMAGAQPLNLQDGLVNLAVGDVTILEDVNVGVAANVAAAICGLEVGPVNVLAESVDADGGTETVCDVTGGPINLTQNAGTPGQSGGAGNSENSNAGGN